MKGKSKVFILEFIVLVALCSLNRGLLLGLLWVILHEISHILIAIKHGLNIYGIQLHVSGVNVNINEIEDLVDKDKFKIYIAGPLFNAISIGVLLILQNYYSYSWIDVSISINLGLVIFNLLPAYPLDGARIYEIIIGKKYLFKKTKNIIVTLSYLVSGILILLFFLTIYIHKANISLLFAVILIIYSTVLEKRNVMYIIMNNLCKKGRRLRRLDYIENKNISVYYKTSLVKAMSLVDKNRYNCFFVLDEGLKLLGVVYEDELIEALKKYGNMSFNDYLNIRE